MRTKDSVRGLSRAIALLVIFAAANASAEATGYELAVSGSRQASAGESLRVALSAFEVEGLASLRALPEARIEAELYRLDENNRRQIVTRSLVADREGRLVVELPIPASTPPGNVTLSLKVGRRGGVAPRTLDFPIEIISPYRFELISDRHRYEPGETIHAFAMLRRRSNGSPIAQARTTLVVTGPDGSTLSSVESATRASGVLFTDIALATSARDGDYTLSVSHESNGHRVTARRVVSVGRRTVERMLVEASVDSHIVAPGGTIEGTVSVRGASGAPIAGVVVQVGGTSGMRPFETNADGVARFRVEAPSFVSGDSLAYSLPVRAEHAAYGVREISVPVVVSRSPYRVEAVAEGNGLVLEVPTRVFLHIVDPLGQPVPAGLEVEALGAAVEGRRQTARTDADGFVVIPMRVGAGMASVSQEPGACYGSLAVPVELRLGADAARHAHICAKVAAEARVAIVAKSAVVAQGTEASFTLARRTGAGAVIVDAIVEGRVVASTFVDASKSEGSIALPPAYAGFVVLRARPLGRFDRASDPFVEGAVAFGVGSQAAILARPADAFGMTLNAGGDVYSVRSTASVQLRVTSPQESGFFTLIARDLAQHGDENDYTLSWLTRVFEAAVVGLESTSHEALVRAALAAASSQDTDARGIAPIVTELWDSRGYGSVAPNTRRDELRDPLRRRDMLVRRGIGGPMMALEGALAREIGTAPEERVVSLSSGGFRPDALARLVERGVISDESIETLGGGRITVAMLQAVDPSFRFEAVAARLSRARLVRLMTALLSLTDPSNQAGARAIDGVPPSRWLSRLVELELIAPNELLDAYGRAFVFRPASRGEPRVVLSERAPTFELVSVGRDGRAGTADDIRDPFVRLVEARTPYAIASGEDHLMRSIAAIAPGERTLAAMLEAYSELNLAAFDELREGVVTASASEAADMAEFAPEMDARMNSRIGAGSGGMGMGYGRGAGSAPMPAPAPPVQAAEEARAQQSAAGSTLARVGELVRERFPATLFFLGEGRLEGVETRVAIPLADALTTYRVEAIGWNASGWMATARTEFRVDQRATVDAAIPSFATLGDALRIPARVENRGSTPLHAQVGLAAEGIELDAGSVVDIVVAPNSSAEIVLPLRATALGSGQVVIRLVSREGEALDAARRPLTIVSDSRLVRSSQRRFIEGTTTFTLDVPSDASERGPGIVRVASGFDLFGRLPIDESNQRVDRAFAISLAGLAISDEDRVVAADLVSATIAPNRRREGAARIMPPRTPDSLARALAIAWPNLPPDLVRAALERLSHDLPETNDRGEVHQSVFASDAERLLGLAPIARDASNPELATLVSRLRALVENGAARTSEMPAIAVLQAAALATTRTGASDARANEVLRRLERYVIRVDGGAFLEGADIGMPHAREIPTSLLAIAYLGTGNRSAALEALRGLVSRPERVMRDGARVYAAAAAGMLFAGSSAAETTVMLDGRQVSLDDRGLVREGVLEGVGRSGEHRLEIRLPRGGAAFVEVELGYGRPWTSTEARRLPLSLSVEGPVGARDTRAGLALAARNTGARIVREPIVEVDLPAGAELDDRARATLKALSRAEPSIEGRVLRLELRPLSPGETIRVPLSFRWTVGGSLRGLGVSAYDGAPTISNEIARAILPSVALDLPDHGTEPERAAAEEPPPRPLPIPSPRPLLRTLAPTEVNR